MVLLLNAKNHIIAKETVFVGTANSAVIHSREIFKRAINRNAIAIIAVHNHPSGDPTPSREDIEITKRMKKAGEIIGIVVIDHVIIGFEKFFSMKAEGII